MNTPLVKRIMKNIAVFGVLLMGIGLAGLGHDSGLWFFIPGVLLVMICAISSRELGKFVSTLLDFI